MPPELPLEISVDDVKKLQDKHAAFLLMDCRTDAEAKTASIPGSSLLPIDQFAARIAELAPNKDQHIVCHCHHGGRSLRATNWLRSQGYKNVQNMTGGIDEWSQKIDAKVPRY